MLNESAVSTRELEEQSAELLPSRETLQVINLHPLDRHHWHHHWHRHWDHHWHRHWDHHWHRHWDHHWHHWRHDR